MADAQSIIKDDRGGTVVPDETTRLKTPGPCPECGKRWWRGPIRLTVWGLNENSGPDNAWGYYAECRGCKHRVRM